VRIHLTLGSLELKTEESILALLKKPQTKETPKTENPQPENPEEQKNKEKAI